MDMKLVGASILAISSIAVFAQTADMRIDKATPMLYQCSITPEALGYAINTKGTGANSGRNAGVGMPAAWDRIDLEFGVTRPTRGQAVPTITAHAINTKGTGVTSGRMSSGRASGATTSCASAVASSGEGVQKVSMNDISITRRTVPGEVPEFSCSVSGTVDRPQFVIGIWTGKIVSNSAGFSESRRRKPRKGESLTDWMASVHNTRFSIVPHSMEPDAALPRVACASETPTMQMKYDLAMLKK